MSGRQESRRVFSHDAIIDHPVAQRGWPAGSDHEAPMLIILPYFSISVCIYLQRFVVLSSPLIGNPPNGPILLEYLHQLIGARQLLT